MKIDDYRDSELVKKITRLISKTTPSRKIKIMHVCGTHENFIGRFGLRSLLPENIELVAGPGCPVCVCPASDINPDKKVVFFSVGFETTAAGVASLIYNNPPDNLSILSSHRLIPPSMELLLGIGDIQIDGFLLPGHVTTVIGMKPFEIFPEAYLMPTVSAGFEPLDILSAVLSIVEQIKEGKASLTNKYTRAVKEDGNPKAIKIMSNVFEEVSSYWRGIGRIPRSGLKLRDKYSKWDANKIFDIEKGDKDFFDIHPHCSCHLIMIGKIYPPDCPLFAKKACNPENPFGPCMVSMDGTCRIWYRYGQKTVRCMT